LVVITDIVDFKTVLVANPSSGVPPTEVAARRLYLTQHVVEVPRGASKDQLASALKGKDFENDFYSNNVIGKKVSQWKRRQNTNDFDRFRVQKLLKRKNELLGKERKIQQKKK